MKKFYFVFLLTAVLGFNLQLEAQSNQNYVRSYTAKEKGLSSLNGQPKEKVMQQTQYFDGLGRLKQTVVKQGSPDGKDIVSYHEYDAFGREAKNYLPITQGVNGEYKAITAQDIINFYTAGSNASSGIASTSNPFSEQRFEQSPLNRVMEIASPGNAWAMSGGKTIKQNYLFNSAADKVLHWELDGDNVLSRDYYTPNSLFKQESIDEDGQKSVTFVDGMGKTILKRNYLSANNHLDTYYVYDYRDQLRYVLPPESIKQLSVQPKSELSGDFLYLEEHTNMQGSPPGGHSTIYIAEGASLTIKANTTITASSNYTFTARALIQSAGQSLLEDYAFQYKYDGRGRMIEKKVPGSDWVYMVYDKRDRLVLTQDGNQKAKNEWLFTKYDALNRPVISGIYADSRTRAQIQSVVDAFTGPMFEERGTTLFQYTNLSFPSGVSSSTVLSVTYYDDYSFSFTNNANYNYQNPNLGNEFVQSNQVRGLPTGGYVAQLGADGSIGNLLAHKSYYDARGRLIQTIADHHVSGRVRTSSAYDFVGKVIRTRQEFLGNAQIATTIETRNEYDHADRLEATYNKVGGNPERKIATYTYNEIGEMISKTLDNNVQKVDYRYNARGWLTSINGGTDFDDAGDIFGMRLRYDDAPVGNRRYNGNIGQMQWRSITGNGDNSSEDYRFTYDGVNRLLKASYMEGTGKAGRFDEDGITYDANGNIKSLKRKHLGASWDDLTYNYKGNRLTRVEDNADHEKGFKNKVSGVGAQEYTYDANGNMISDSNKGISTIEYNYLNLPRKVVLASNKYVEYTYDATGTKLRKNVVDEGSNTTSDYIHGLHLTDGILEFVPTAEGRYIFADNGYQYVLTDHLGNTRVTFDAEPKVDTYIATLEDNNQQLESINFDPSYDNAMKITSNLYNRTPGGSKSVRLSGANANEMVALGKALKVEPGDVVNIEVYSKHIQPTSTNTQIGSLFIGALTGLFAPGAGIDASGLQDVFQLLGSEGLLFNTGNNNLPKAYVNYILFDENYIPLDFGFKQVTSAGLENGSNVPHERLELRAQNITQSGYLYIYLSNESDKVVEVFFDDLKITHHHSPIVQAADYYPFGLTFNSYQRTNSAEQRYLYNGKEKQDLSDWLDYGARMYMPEIGRWGVVDPLADQRSWVSPYNFVQNNPLNRIDPDGRLDWVLNAEGDIYWDKNATSQETTKSGETYLGRDLTFTFNSYISGTFDGPNPPWGAEGDKLTSTISIKSHTDSDNNLLSVDVESDYFVHSTGGLSVFKGRDYFPGLGKDQNKAINLTGVSSFSATFEQHASVPGFEAFGLNLLGYDVVNVAQKLNLGLSGNNLSVTAATDVFPSATLSVNGVGLFQYNQPSFKGTHGRDYRTTFGDNGMGGSTITETIPRRPTPSFYRRYPN